MKRFFAFSLAVAIALLGVAFAQIIQPLRVTFDDAGFNYFDKEEGYIHLTREGDQLMVWLNDEAEGGLKLEFDELDTAEVDEEDFSHEYLMYRAGVDPSFNGVELTFHDSTLPAVMQYMTDKLVDLNFIPVEELATANTHVYDCGCAAGGDIHLRVVFTRHGENVYVGIKSL